MSSNLDEGTPYLFGFVLHTFSFLVDSPGVFIKYHHALSLSKKDGFRWHCWHCWYFRNYWRRSWQSWHIYVVDITDQVVIIMIRKIFIIMKMILTSNWWSWCPRAAQDRSYASSPNLVSQGSHQTPWEVCEDRHWLQHTFSIFWCHTSITASSATRTNHWPRICNLLPRINLVLNLQVWHLFRHLQNTDPANQRHHHHH